MKSRPCTGVVLILVLVMIVVLTIASLGLSQWMLAQRDFVQRLGRQMQARALADSGVEMAKAFLDRDPTAQQNAGGSYDNPQRFQNVVVVEDSVARDRGRFTILAPRIQDRAAAEIRYGLEDESTRINLRTILKADSSGEDGARRMLLVLPGMTEPVADAILDWIDEDNTPRPMGAEIDTYSSQTPGYAPRNAPPATIEELLLVRGVTPRLLFGLDADRMGRTAAEAASDDWEGVDNADGAMNHGWAAYLTLYSMESTMHPDGTPKVNLNDDDLKQLHDDLEKALSAEWATFIVAYRQSGSHGKMTPGRSSSTGKTATGKLDFTKKATVTIKSVLDLVGVRTSAKFEGAQSETTLDSPFAEDRARMADYLPKLLDNTTTTAKPVIAGRININQAPRLVLSSIPGMTLEVVDQIISKRMPDPATANPEHRYETWILTEGIVPLETMKTMLPFVTAGGSVYRVQSIGFFDEGKTSSQLEVILDASRVPASTVFWRDVSHLRLWPTPGTVSPAQPPE